MVNNWNLTSKKNKVIRDHAIINRRWINILFFSLFISSQLYCQTDTTDYLSYFPLHVGNKWQYKIVSDLYYPDSVSYKTVEVLNDTIMPNGIKYKALKNFSPNFIRIDSSSLIIYSYDETSNTNHEKIIYNLSGLLSDTTRGEFNIKTPDNTSAHHRWEKGSSVVGTFGDTTNCLWYMPSDVIDIAICFSQDFGISYKFWQEIFTFYHYLTGAEINGEKYGHFVATETITPKPTKFTLSGIYPTPFNTQTIIKYNLPEPMTISIDIYNLAGSLVHQIIKNHNLPGTYSTKWTPNNIASGIYIIHVKNSFQYISKKVIYVK